MPWRTILTCHICGATEHRVYEDDEEPIKHVCRASLVGEQLTSL